MITPKRKTFALLAALLYVILTLHLLALYFYWYWMFWWYDILLHFLGGLWLGGTALWFLQYVKEKPMSRFKQYMFPVAMVILIGLGWELFEFSLDTFVIFQTNDIIDTISDLWMDVAGSLTATIFMIKNYN
ncbi:hypothetical protein ACFL0K_00185 [Patescibacteria group bacterium]